MRLLIFPFVRKGPSHDFDLLGGNDTEMIWASGMANRFLP